MASYSPENRNSKIARWRFDVGSEDATIDVARQVAGAVAVGDLVTLSGDLGAGKTTFARALIREIMGDPELEVPSPTFTLMQNYEGPRFPIVHADLYRIGEPDELIELGWEDAASCSLMLVEWPERAEHFFTAHRLDVRLDIVPDSGGMRRTITLTGTGGWAERIQQARALSDLLDHAGWGNARRDLVQGDASSRLYERLVLPGKSAILMISPTPKHGPIIRAGKTYRTLARLADDVSAFVALAKGLRTFGVSAPEIYAANIQDGLVLMEDLGSDGFVDHNGPIRERYLEAVRLLAEMHGQELPRALPVVEGQYYTIPTYDLEPLMVEIELFLDWYVPSRTGKPLSGSARGIFLNLWRRALEPLALAEPTWVLRDFHSPNLIWQPSRDGTDRVGVIDFQDTLIGHPAYDVGSIIYDARVQVPESLASEMTDLYVHMRTSKKSDFDGLRFSSALALFSAQRLTKILGIFVRLDQRDGKPQYLKHIPMLEGYLRRNLSHHTLGPLKAWYGEHMPDLFGSAD